MDLAASGWSKCWGLIADLILESFLSHTIVLNAHLRIDTACRF